MGEGIWIIAGHRNIFLNYLYDLKTIETYKRRVSVWTGFRGFRTVTKGVLLRILSYIFELKYRFRIYLLTKLL
jgi:hypothetical protein